MSMLAVCFYSLRAEEAQLYRGAVRTASTVCITTHAISEMSAYFSCIFKVNHVSATAGWNVSTLKISKKRFYFRDKQVR